MSESVNMESKEFSTLPYFRMSYENEGKAVVYQVNECIYIDTREIEQLRNHFICGDLLSQEQLAVNNCKVIGVIPAANVLQNKSHHTFIDDNTECVMPVECELGVDKHFTDGEDDNAECVKPLQWELGVDKLSAALKLTVTDPY